MKVTVITVAYNSAKTLADAIESVLRQTYQDIEYWIIDGQSSDNSLEIIRKYEDKFNGRLHWITEKDSGIYDAMNKGIVRATGDVIGILNSDDYFTTDDVIEKMVAQFTDDVDAVYGDVHFVKEENHDKCVRYYSGKIFRPWLVRFGFQPPHPSLYVRREMFEKYGLYNTAYTLAGDFDMIARLAWCHQVKMKYIHQDFVTMRTGGASTRNAKNRMLNAREVYATSKDLGLNKFHYLIYLKFPIKVIESLLIRS